jgi:hypothetical protein
MRIVAYVAVSSLVFAGRSAETQSGAPSPAASSGSASIPANVLTPRQMARISREQSKVDRLNREIYEARQRVLSLQLAVLPEAKRAATAGAVVGSMSNDLVLTEQANTIGLETNDSVAFARRDSHSNLIITGVGTVMRVYPDYMDVVITSRGTSEQVRPDDEVYVISRQDSPASLARCFNKAGLE